jgi:hypothetical protein
MNDGRTRLDWGRLRTRQNARSVSRDRRRRQDRWSASRGAPAVINYGFHPGFGVQNAGWSAIGAENRVWEVVAGMLWGEPVLEGAVLVDVPVASG